MHSRPSTKIIFFAADPGGRNELLATQEWIESCFDGREINTDTNCIWIEKTNLSEQEVRSVLTLEKPDFVFCGTSAECSTEHLFFTESQNLGIPSIGFIDHWTNLKARFIRDRKVVFPNLIFVNDEKALDLAIEEGIPKDKLMVFGNPFFEKVKNFQPRSSKKEALESLGANLLKPLVVFLSDCLSENAGSETNAIEEYGFSEYSILEQVLSYLDHDAYDFIVKLHPKEDKQKYKRYGIKTIQSFSLHELLYHSDFQIGMFSTAVLEASLLGKTPFRLELNAKKDLLPIAPSGVQRITHASELSTSLNAYLKTRPNKTLNRLSFDTYRFILPKLLALEPKIIHGVRAGVITRDVIGVKK